MDKKNDLELIRWSSCDGASSAEQFMMAEEARLFGDGVTRAQIVGTTSPREHEALGGAGKICSVRR